MRNPGGYLIITSETGTEEYDTFTCAHCNDVTIVKPGDDPAQIGGFCTICNALTCGKPECQSCTPFEKQLDLIEKRDRLLRSIGV